MSDIFDDIDEILSGAEETEASAVTEAEGENFNEAELQDIMSEIESLEKEFEEGESMEVAAMIQDAVMEEINAELKKETDPKPSLQDEIERELEASRASAGDPEEVTPVIISPIITASTPATAPIEKEAAVLSFEKPAPKSSVTAPVAPAAPTMTSSSGVSFAAQGSMALTLDFKVGAENAKLTIDPVKGLTVVLSGVELTINETDGCHVTMDNGMKFTVPLSSMEKSQKKSA